MYLSPKQCLFCLLLGFTEWSRERRAEMTFSEHCNLSIATFGTSYDFVHRWLDEFAGIPPHGMRHRKFRHHLAGIDAVRALWGDEAAEAARQHIEADIAQEGWTTRDHFPKDQDDYVKMGLF